MSGSPLRVAAANAALKLSDLAGLPEAYAYTYDAAQNLIARSEATAAVPTVTALPLDGSGRNRPGSAGGVALIWDRNGNLIQKGNLHVAYDFRNRLTDVTDANGNAVAHYDYDAFNRRVARTVGTDVHTTVWQGWRPIEDYDGTRLLQRRTYGEGLDDILYLEADLDGSGNVTAKSWPIYDSAGNLVLLTNSLGLPLERYDYTPYGSQTILVNSTPPAVQRVRVVGRALWVELTEAVISGPLSQALAAGTLTLFDNTQSTAFGNLAVAQPVTTGDLAFRRLVLIAQPPSAFNSGDQVTLTIPPGALVDSFLNQPAQPYTLTFAWPATDGVLADLTAPILQRVSLVQGNLEVELSAEASRSTIAAIQLDGAPLNWTLDSDHYTLTSTSAVSAGAHTLTIATTLTDLGGQPLATAFSNVFPEATGQDMQTLFAAPNPQASTASAVGNLFGFEGMPLDPETGFVYFRNRYYDPQLGRFATTDPMGYTDGPSMYAFERNDPSNTKDPFGLSADIPVVTPTAEGAAEVREAAGDLGVANSTYDECIRAGKSDDDVGEMNTPEEQRSVNDRGQHGPGIRCVGKVARKTESAAGHAAAAGMYALDAAAEFQIYRDALRAAIAAGKRPDCERVHTELVAGEPSTPMVRIQKWSEWTSPNQANQALGPRRTYTLRVSLTTCRPAPRFLESNNAANNA
jgi:RHS repeat-associated protein